MIRADTNVVLSLLMPPRRSEASRIVEQAETFGPFVVSECVFVEVCWVLESVYSIRRGDVALMIGDALQSEHLVSWDAALSRRALGIMGANERLSAVDALLAAHAADGDMIFTLDRALASTIQNL
ncbi:MAG: PIN domain-containing protein [Coriobacteriia bacterium]|nr:PIN domain-containing protein [Coriobacteriia bacterium]